MALESDSRGFLVGDPIDLKRMPNDISHIRDDVSAIRRAIAERGRNFSRTDRAPRPNAVMPERGANGRFVSSASPAVATPTGPRKGDSNLAARFAGNAKVIALPAARSAGVVSSIAARLESADPSVKAAREIAEPLQRGLELFRGGDKQTSWLKKIFKSLNIFHKEDTVYNRAAKKSLKAIEEKSAFGGGDDDSFSGAATGSILGRAIPWVLGGLAAAGTGIATTIGGALTTAIAAIFSPIGIAVAAAGVAAWGLFTDDGRKFFADLGGKMAEGWSRFTDFLIQSSPKTMAFLGKIGEKVDAAYDAVKEQAKDANTYIEKNTGVNLADMGSKWLERTKGGIGRAYNAVAEQFNDAKTYAANSFLGKSIPSLSPAQIAALAADTRRTESSGNYSAENKLGYLGSYQFGAAALADTGLIDTAKLKAAKKRGRFNQKSFLADPSNWLLAGGKDAFLGDQSLQDQTYSKYSAQLQKAGIRAGVLSADSSPEQVAAYIKAAHLVGAGGANNYFVRGIDGADANGTLASKYAKQGALAVASAARISAPPKAPSMPPIAEAPKVVQPLSSPVTPQFTVNISSQDVGQTVRDSTTAYIASGGVHKRP